MFRSTGAASAHQCGGDFRPAAAPGRHRPLSIIRSHSVKERACQVGLGAQARPWRTKPLSARGLPSLVRNCVAPVRPVFVRARLLRRASQSRMRAARSAHFRAPNCWTMLRGSRRRRFGLPVDRTGDDVRARRLAVTPSDARAGLASSASPRSQRVIQTAGGPRWSEATWRPNWAAEDRPARVSSGCAQCGVCARRQHVFARLGQGVARRRARRPDGNAGKAGLPAESARSNDWQKAWIVPMRMPPGRSSTWANSERAAVRVARSARRRGRAALAQARRRSALPNGQGSSAIERPSRWRRPW